ncbi:energy transducer TonB [Sabulilitoribacter arenilitoris]|uniref:Energy transducer TonB n=1 Tax=Wocania arenilitoris TaxID=2044858 RepID=A0AAE3JLG2_9FLAO|nr:energy transducer TonB [Wocania arenilitoris]MCF7569243.1 energy transducer TonB [Wocania arenilitoris]
MKPKKNPELEIGRHSSLYFAIGLNVMLFLSWQALEYKTYDKELVTIDVLSIDEELDEDIPIVNIDAPPPPPPPAVIQEAITIVEDVEEVEETIIESTEANQSDALEERIVAVSDVDVEEVEEDVEVPFAAIENVPVFPGCEGQPKKKMKDCFQKKIQEHIVKNFKYPDVALDMSIQGRVSVIFVIDSKGHTTNVRSRGPDKVLETEAERIIGLLPKMTPGNQRGKPVKVSYAVPIFFKLYER